MRKKLFTLFFALVADIGTMFAAVVIDGIAYNLNDDAFTAEVTKGANYSGEVAIPSSVTYNAQNYSVTSIGYATFSGCRGLTSVTIPNSVTYIGDSLFSSCSSLTTVEIPNSVTYIGSHAFSSTGLTSVTIGNSVTSIENSAFWGCSRLKTIIVEKGNEKYDSRNDCNAIIETATNTLILGCQNTIIPNSVTSIGGGAFSGCTGLTSIEIPNSVTYLSGFSGCTGLTSVVIPNSVTSIGNSAFYGCTGLTSVTISNSVTSIGNSAFYGCTGLTSVTISNSVTSIGNSAFYGCTGLMSVIIGNGVTSIGVDAFNGCIGLVSVTIPNSVTYIGNNAFYRCTGLTNVVLGSSVKILERSSFAYCSSIKTITCYSQRPPTVTQYALYGLDYSTIVYVPVDYLDTYKMHDTWGLYDVRPIDAEKEEVDAVEVETSESAASIAWPQVSGAYTYELVIKDKDGNIVCTLVFNAQGQLLSIKFNAPSQNGAPQHTQAAGFAFTVTGLDAGTNYSYSITSKNESGTILNVEEGTFRTQSYEAVDEVSDGQSRGTKFFRDGQILIEKNGKTFDLRGQEVR